jgi:urease subunit beta
MIPGEILVGAESLPHKPSMLSLNVTNSGDRPIQVGSHFHFYEVNKFLIFERDKTRGLRLNIPSGTAVRFEPGQTRRVELVAFLGLRQVHGFRNLVNGPVP